ncbi:MAG: K(+)-transporting ATPase subunit C [Opitutaceae bacterium]|jgi:K+-transporting ATPase ATPase C chain
MKTFLSELRTALLLTAVLAVLLCGVYPLAVWAGAQTLFHAKANGSLVTDADGTVRGSALLGQSFTSDKYFNSRPSAAGSGYDAASSSGTNLGPTSRKLADAIKTNVAAYRAANGLAPDVPVPADAVTASASGLDPHISLANARLQSPRIAKVRNLPPEQVAALIEASIDSGGLFGENGVNVLRLNRSLDEPSRPH